MRGRITPRGWCRPRMPPIYKLRSGKGVFLDVLGCLLITLAPSLNPSQTRPGTLETAKTGHQSV